MLFLIMLLAWNSITYTSISVTVFSYTVTLIRVSGNVLSLNYYLVVNMHTQMLIIIMTIILSGGKMFMIGRNKLKTL